MFKKYQINIKLPRIDSTDSGEIIFSFVYHYLLFTFCALNYDFRYIF